MLCETLMMAGPTPNPSGIMIDGGGAYQVMRVDSGATLSLANLTIENGNAASSPWWGSGIYNHHGMLTVTNSIFSGNELKSSHSGWGSGIFNDHGTVTITSSSRSASGASAGCCSAGGSTER